MIQDLTCLDFRARLSFERLEALLRAYGRLAEGDSIVIITDNEPRPLFARLYEAHRNAFVWDERCIGEREWTTRITRRRTVEKPTAIQWLGFCPVFLRVSEQAMTILQSPSQSVSKRGTIVCCRDEMPAFVGVLVDGLLQATSDYNGEREYALYEIKPFEVFAAMEGVDGGRSIANVKVLSDTATYLRIDQRTFREAMSSDMELQIAMSRVAVQRFRSLSVAFGASLSLPMPSRVALALLPYAAPEAGMQRALAPLSSMTQSEVAVAVGSVKEVVARTISVLEAKNGLRRKQGHIAFLDRSRLLELSEEIGSACWQR